MKTHVQIRIKNGAMFERMKALGLDGVSLAQKAKVGKTSVYQALALKVRHFGDLTAAKIAAALNLDLDDIRPRWMLLHEEEIETKFERIVDIPPDRLLGMSQTLFLPSPVDVAVAAEIKDGVQAILDQLSSREQEVLKLRFGLDGLSEHTYEEIANIYGVTRERIRQIEIRALKKSAVRARRVNFDEPNPLV